MASTVLLLDVLPVFWLESNVRAKFVFGWKDHLLMTSTIGRSLPLALSSCAILGAVVGGYDYAGQLAGDATTTEERRKKFFKTPPKPLIEVDSTTT